MKEFLEKHVKWFSQGALKIVYGENVLYTDPFGIDAEYNDADVILLTHPHFDHLSPEDIAKVIKEDTIFIVPASFSDLLDVYPTHQIVEVYPGDVLNLEYMELSVVPAYNLVKTDCHPLEKGWVGYVMEFEEATLYYTSDTELIPEMEDIETDIIFLPMGQTYTFECVEDAAKAALLTQAEVAVPIHYGKYEGTKEDVEKFKELLEGKVEVVVL